MDVIVEGRSPAVHQMKVDADLISRGSPRPIIRFYKWPCFCVTAGLFTNPSKFIDIKCCEEMGIEVVKRPTAGGLLFHHRDIAFTLFYPEGHHLCSLSVEESSREINTAIFSALSPWLPEQGEEVEIKNSCCRLCMAQKTGFDLIWSGYKIGGCAQRRTRHGLLHQVSLFCSPFNWKKIASILLSKRDVLVMRKTSKVLSSWKGVSRELIREAIREEFIARG